MATTAPPLSKTAHPLRWGILGTAAIAKHTVRALRAFPDGVAYAVGSRDLQKAREWASEQDVPHAYGSYQQVIDDPNVDVVYIPLPTVLHKEWVLKAAAKGKHVLCDKPVGACSADISEMIAACQAHNVLFMDGVMWFHHKRTRDLQHALFTDKVIGDVRHVTSTFHWQQKDGDIRLQPAMEPHGALGDLGWYTLGATIVALGNDGMPDRIFANVVRDPATGAIMSCFAHLAYPNRQTASLSCTFETSTFQMLGIFGTTGSIEVPSFVWPFHPSLAYRISRPEGSPGEERTVQEDRTPHNNYGLIETVSHLVRDIQAGKKRNTFWEQRVLLTQRLLDAVLEAAKK